MAEAQRIRVVTYNIHKCRGLDRRVSPARIVDVLRRLDADCIAFQEVVRAAGAPETDQAEFIAAALQEYEVVFGPNRPLGKGDYGNRRAHFALPLPGGPGVGDGRRPGG